MSFYFHCNSIFCLLLFVRRIMIIYRRLRWHWPVRYLHAKNAKLNGAKINTEIETMTALIAWDSFWSRLSGQSLDDIRITFGCCSMRYTYNDADLLFELLKEIYRILRIKTVTLVDRCFRQYDCGRITLITAQDSKDFQ